MGVLNDLYLATQVPEKKGDGWLSASEWAVEEQQSVSRTQRILNVLVKEGLVKCKTFRKDYGGVFKITEHYKLEQHRTEK